jgi:hypothetical protein
MYGTACPATQAAAALPLPVGGTLSNFYVLVQGTSPAATMTATVFINGSTSTVTCTLPASTANASCNDTTRTATVTAGQSVTVQLATTGNYALPVSWAAKVAYP